MYIHVPGKLQNIAVFRMLFLAVYVVLFVVYKYIRNIMCYYWIQILAVITKSLIFAKIIVPVYNSYRYSSVL